MATSRKDPTECYSLPPAEAAAARESSALIAELVEGDARRFRIRLVDPPTGRQVDADLPPSVLRLLADALAQMADGRTVSLMPTDAELSTQQVAELLGVSRPYCVKLLEEGHIPFRKVGSQRRVRVEALRCYMDTYRREAVQALASVTAEAQKLSLYE